MNKLTKTADMIQVEVGRDKLVKQRYELISDSFRDTLEMVNEGLIDPLRAYVALKNIEKNLANVMEQMKAQAIDEATKHGKTCTILGSEVTVKNAAGRWSFKHIDKWNELIDELKAFEEAAKQAYHAQLKGAAIVNEATGEIVEPAQYSEGQTTISIKV